MEELFPDIFLDDLVQVEEENPDDDIKHDSSDDDDDMQVSVQSASASAPRKKGTTRALRKREKEGIVAHLESIGEDELAESIEKKVDKRLHMHVYEDRLTLFRELTSTHVARLKAICNRLTEMFIAVYKECDKGKDKYARFQMKWHDNTAQFLLEPNSSTPREGHILWDHVSTSASCESRNAVVIAIVSETYDHLLWEVLQYAMSQQRGTETSASTSDPMPNPEPHETYYRFGGGALADMLHHRYKQMKSNTCTNKDRVSGEIQVLKWMQMVDSDKERLPESLKYRDRGHMYFPHPKLIPFIKNLDDAVRTTANITEYKRLGKDLVEVTTAHIQKDPQLFKSFTAAISEIAMDIDDTNPSLISVYKEFSRKICNTRINEFIDVQKQLSVMKSGKASLSGQNLRDTLLTSHVQMKTRSNS